MKAIEPILYRSSSQPCVHTAPMLVTNESPIICETFNADTTEPQPSSNAQNSSATPRATGPREWPGFSQYEIDYGIRAGGRA